MASRRRGGGISLDLSQMQRNIDMLPAKIDRAVFAAVETQRAPAESWMRGNAKWTDRTTNARNGLIARTNHVPLRRHELILAHSVPYGIWLEVRWSGRYAIIEPGVADQGPKVMRALEGLFGRI